MHPLGAPTVNAAPIATTVFHRLFGDADGATQTGNQFTALVNTADNGGPSGFRATFNTPANYKAHFDFDGDSIINTADNFQFRNRFNRPLTWSA